MFEVFCPLDYLYFTQDIRVAELYVIVPVPISSSCKMKKIEVVFRLLRL